MIDLSDIDYVKGLKSNLHVVFDSPQGKEVMMFIEILGGWYPRVGDSMETNEIISRDANRRMIGTLKSIMNLKAEQIVALTERDK